MHQKSIPKVIKNMMRFWMRLGWLLGGILEGFWLQVGGKLGPSWKPKPSKNDDENVMRFWMASGRLWEALGEQNDKKSF